MIEQARCRVMFLVSLERRPQNTTDGQSQSRIGDVARMVNNKEVWRGGDSV